MSGCLEKDPGLRPTAEALSEALTATAPASPPDPREALRAVRPHEPADSGDTVPGEEAWLPEPLVRLIAERSAAGLALPSIDDTEIDPASADPASDGAVPTDTTTAGQPASRAVGRRRLLLLAGGAVAVTAGGGAAAWAALAGDGGNDTPAPEAAGPVHTIGLHADLTGDQKTLGLAQERGCGSRSTSSTPVRTNRSRSR